MADILIVEDNPSLQRLIQLLLDREGHTTRLAGDLPQALRCLHDSSPALVILDLNLPSGNALEVLPQLTRPQRFRVLVVSGMKQECTLETARQSGADAYLAKPFRPSELLSQVQQLLPPEPNAW